MIYSIIIKKATFVYTISRTRGFAIIRILRTFKTMVKAKINDNAPYTTNDVKSISNYLDY